MQPVELYPGVVSHPDVLGGKPIIRGSRIPVDLVLGQLAGGMTVDEIIYEYGIGAEDVRAALGYAAQQVAAEAVHATR